MFMDFFSQNGEDILCRPKSCITSSLTKGGPTCQGNGSILVVAEQSPSMMHC